MENNPEREENKDKKEPLSEVDDKKEYHFIYFIESHDESKQIKISFPDYKDANTLEFLIKKDSSKLKKSLISNLYRFKLFPENCDISKKDDQIAILIEEKKQDETLNQSKFIIKVNDINKDFYEYNLNMENINPFRLSYDQQFEIYIEYLRKVMKKLQNTKENDELIISTQLLLKEKYDFLFYLLIFLECFLSKLSCNHLLSFDPEKIRGIGHISEQKLKQVKNILNMISKKPEMIKIDKENENLKNKAIEIFYFIFFYFNVSVMKEKVSDIIKDDKIFNHLYARILQNQKFLCSIILPNDIVCKLIEKSKNFDQALISILYLGKDTVNVLYVINEKKDVFTKLLNELEENEEKEEEERGEEKIKMIEFENYILIKPEDDLKKIKELISQIIEYELKESKIIKFSNTTFDQYIEFNINSNIENLKYINDIILSIKKTDKKYQTNYKIEFLIHDTTLSLIENKKMKNMEILDFISKDNFYSDKQYRKMKMYRPLKVFNGIDISSLDEEFFKKWNEIDFNEIFEEQFEDFSKKIASLINEMKNFKLLFKLFKVEIDKDPPYQYIKAIKERFIQIFETYYKNICMDFPENVALLIILIDKKKLNVIEFLKENIHNHLNAETINNIYIKTTELYNDYLSKETIDFIVDFFIKNNSSNPSALVLLIQQCKNLRKKFFSSIDKYIPREEDFFFIEETDRYIFFKGLVDKKILEKENFQKYGENYISKVNKLICSLENKLELYEIKYSKIYPFFKNANDKKSELILLDRIVHIYLLNEVKAKKTLDKLKEKINELTDIITKLNDIYTYFADFFPNKHKKDIENIGNIVLLLNDNVLNSFEINYKNDYNNYINYYDEAIKRLKKKDSIIFNTIYTENKNKIKDDIECLKETEKNFEEFKNLFKENGIQIINQQLLELCINQLKENENALKNEINYLVKIFEIKEDTSISKIYVDILLISKKEYIYNIGQSINTFLKCLNPKKTNFQDDINTINELIQKRDIENIKKCKNLLENYNISLDDKENKYIEILILLNNQPDSIKFLLETSIQDCRNLQELSLENDNNFISVNDILDMEKCVEFFLEIGKLEDLKSKEDYEIINLLRDNTSKHPDILLYIKKYADNFNQIIALKGTLNKSEFLKHQIQALFDNAVFDLSNKRNDQFLCTYIQKDKKNKEKKLNKENIIDLKERAQLAKMITPDYKCFIESVTKIINISNVLENICNKGYPKILEIKIIFNIIKKIKEQNDNNLIKKNEEEYIDNNLYFFGGKQSHSYEEIIENLKKILITLKTKETNAYETKELIRFIYGRQFNLFYDYFHKKDNSNINSFLKYIMGDYYKIEVKNFKVEEKGDIIESNINNCENFLNEELKINNIKLENIYKSTLIKNDIKEKYKGLYSFLCEKLEKDLFQIYKYLTGNVPIAQNVLLCNKDTSNEEISSFLYRAVKCKFNSCFIVGGIELLNFEQKALMIKLLEQFFQKDENKINSCLIILFINKSSDIYKNLGVKKYKKIFNVNRKIFEKEMYEGNDIEIVKSDKSGVGKSTQIKKDIEDNKKKWIYFPIGGVFTREDIIRRLKELQIDINCVIHFDLYDTDQTSLLLDFLFSILITRFYGQNEDIFYLSKNIPIKIEIPNSFINFFEKFQILTLFNKKELTISNLSPLIVPPNQIDSNIQIVANYLKSLKEHTIDGHDLIFPNITPEEWANRSITFKKPKKVIKTAIFAKYLSPQECQKLIFDVIKEKIKEPTYYQIISFINILAVQLKKLNKNFFLNAHELILTGKNINYIRTLIVESFIKLTKHFTEGAFTELLKSQTKVHNLQFGLYNEGEDLNNAINVLANYNHEVISFKAIDPSLLFFHEGDGESFSIITNKKPTDKEYINLLNLKNCQALTEEMKLKAFPKYSDKNFDKINFLKELKEILSINNPVKESEKSKDSEYKSLEEISGNYVFTADNFVKMILILLRIRSNIPVIMMGETGCGKTSLIRKLAEMKNNGNAEKMKILNIHAGTDDNDIIIFLKKKVIPEAEELEKKNIIEREKRRKLKQFYEGEKIWVFLDEINTCKSMGLISELMCKHSYQGNLLPPNIVFIAACNPYRQREKKEKNDEKQIGLDINLAKKEKKHLNDKEKEEIARAKNSNLVYTVNPLPHSLLNFVFDFGNLTEDDEEDYIRCIIKESIEKIYYKSKNIVIRDLNLEKLKKLAGDMIIDAHKFIREFNDKSAVSLREIRRFNIFYEFFYDYLNKRKEFINREKTFQLNEPDKEFYQNLDEFSLQVYAINLSVFICYYLRITNKDFRKQLLDKMNKILNAFSDTFKKVDFLELPLKEEKFIVNNIKLDKGIAKNRALLENIFSLFVAINNKVPIFIVGKPGCSKSLSFQLLNKSMQGRTSDNAFFKKYPKLMVNSYQGSMASKSKDVENLFAKARFVFQNLDEKYKENNISMIYFDEMGLAEHSPNNPLKVIHAELEYDQNEGDKKVAFVGISNWALDASKMNRGISISIPEPTDEDNIETSLTIGRSFNDNLASKYNLFFQNLGLTYFNYKKYLKEKHNSDGKEDFHGNRDFYHLVKNAARNMDIKENNKELNENNLVEIGVNSIERNFGGIQFDDIEKKTSLEIVKDIFKVKYPPVNVTKEYNVLQRIKENVNDLNSRYLLVISKSSISTFLISSILSEDNKEYSFYIGSKFKSDLNTEEYTLKVLNKIQAHMENGNILIMKDLESVYPSMYDLFNQNFTVLSNRNYARLAVGSSVNTFSFVNDKFRCIVSVDINQINNEEVPFLNRFEKHIMSFEYLLNKEQITESEKIKSNLNELIKCKENEFKAFNYDLSKLLINCNIDEIQALMYKAIKKGKKGDEITDYILGKIALTLPQDIIINMGCNAFKRKNLYYYEKILELYSKGEHTNFANFLKKVDINKNVVYTFSNSLENIINIKNIKNEKLGLINEENITNIKISSLNKENELEKLLDDFFNEDTYKICLIKFMPFEGDFMNYVRYLIENKEKNYKNKDQKYFIFIVYMTRVFKEEIKNLEKKNENEQIEIKKKYLNETLTYLSGYYQIFIDNLNGEDYLTIDKIIQMNKSDLFKNCLNTDDELRLNIFTSISYMKYTINGTYKELNKDNYVEKLIEFITNHKRLRFLINECLFREILVKKNEDIISKCFKEKNLFSGDEIDLLSLIKKYILKIYLSNLNLFFFKAEKAQFFSSLLTNEIDDGLWKDENEDKTIIEKNAKLFLDNLQYNDNLTKVTEKLGANKVDIMFGIKFPGIKPIFDRILKFINENITSRYRNNENNLRTILDEETEKEEIQNYFRILNSCDNSANNIIKQEEKLMNIIKSNNEENIEDLYNIIINDYYSLFLNKNLNKKKNKKEKEGHEENDEKEKEQQVAKINDFNANKKFIDLMVEKRNLKIKIFLNQNENEKETDIIKRISQAINFVESYEEEICTLQEMFLKLNPKTINLLEQMVDVIEKKQIEYEISPRNPEYTSIVNEVFFLSVDSILRVMISNDEIYDIKKGQEEDEYLFELIHIYKEILQIALQLENKLNLRSKEAFSLQEILKLFDAFTVNKMANVKNLKKVIQYFGEETLYNNNKNSQHLCENLNKFYKFLTDELGKNKKFNLYKILGFIFSNEYIKITFDNFREVLLNKILEKKEFIKNSSQIIRLILGNVFEAMPSEMLNNLESIKMDDGKLFRKINNINDEFLDEIILNIFEGKITLFFEQITELDEKSLKDLYPKYFKDNQGKIRNITGIVFDNSLDIFKQVVEFLDNISSKKDDIELNKKENIHICKLYSIAYVKIYLSKVVYLIKEKFEEKEVTNYKNIMKIIQSLKNKAFGKVLKIYIFKLFYNYMNNNFEQFKNFNYKAKGIEFTDEFPTFDIVKDEILLTYFFLPLDENDYNKYLEEVKQFEIIKNIKFNTSTKGMAEIIEKDGLDIFLLVSINKIISNLGLKNYIADKDEYQNFSSYIKSLFKTDFQITEKIRQLLYLFYNDKTYLEKMRPKLVDENGLIDQKLFETILYGFTFCFNTLYNEKKENSLYKSILQRDCSESIAKSFIPGIDIKPDTHLDQLPYVKEHLDNFEDGCGCYTCSCGYYYSIGPCGFPTKGMTFQCPLCKLDIGYGPKKVPGGASNHGMIIRAGHYRIFKDGRQRAKQMSRWNDPDENIPNITLDKYMKEVINPILKKSNFGFNQIPRDFFENQKKTIRNLSKIGYRLLNFISYCHLFFAYCLDFISEENMKKNLIEDMSILKIIQTDWKLLEESLKQKNVGSIQIFMNLIFKKLSQMIKDCKILTKSEDRDKFENDIEKLIEECIKEYPNSSKKYNEKNKKQLDIGNFHMKTIVTELVEPTEENYPVEEYPMFRYFILTKYKTIEDCENRLENQQQYPLLRQLLKNMPGVRKLKNLPAFNDFTNFMVDNYSFKISRDDAKRKELDTEEDIQANKAFKKKYNNFIKSWNEIKTDAIKYKCRPEMPVKTLSPNDKLINFLNDNGELYGGMYIASACQNFIEWQNLFLQPIVDVNVAFNGILHHYVENIQKKIPIQDSKKDQILLIEQRFEASNYLNLNDIIYSFSERKIFGENGKINYSDYNSFEYDYDSIEEELGKIILPGVCQFEGEDKLNFVTFWSEGFRGDRSEILSKFYMKYPQRDLSNEEKGEIMEYINKMNKEKMAKNNIKYDFKEFFGSMQIIIFYLTERVVTKPNEKISEIFKNPPPYLKISDDCFNFFLNEGSQITIDKLMNLFFFFEHLCYEDLAETVQPEYRKEISEDVKNLIIKKLIKNYKNDLYTLKDLGAAVRRFISRYLAGKLQTTEIKEDLDLPYQLSRTDLWEEKIGNDDSLGEKLYMQLAEFKLIVAETYSFYELIGGEDKKSINFFTGKKDEEKRDKFNTLNLIEV